MRGDGSIQSLQSRQELARFFQGVADNYQKDGYAGGRFDELQVSPNGDWANNLALDVVVKGTKYSPPATLDNDGYFWRVRAKDAANVAKEARAECLIATHFSSRYDSRQVAKIGSQARGIFENITIGRDLLEIDI